MSERFYYYEGKKIPLSPSVRRTAVRFGTASLDTRKRASAALGGSPQATGLDLGDGLVLFEAPAVADRSMAPAVAPLGGRPLEVFETPDQTVMIAPEEFIAQFVPSMSRAEIDSFNAANNVSVVRESDWERNSFVLRVDDPKETSSVDKANLYQESGKVVYAQPNFVRVMRPSLIPNDSLFSQQWALRNTGQGGGVAGQDIHTTDAWDVTRGSGLVTVAIIDEGVDYAHPDLNVPGKLVTGYNAENRTNDPAPAGNDAHGTCCAGIAAAAGGNGVGITGVAPGCRLMGVRVAHGVGNYWSTSDAILADGIATAAARGADVLSNSWGGGSPSTAITNAIRQARTTGRGGKGCVVCFAAGNSNGPVQYPATLPEVITVAACNEFGERKSPTSHDGENWWGSCFGPEVDVSAPGVHVVSTDIVGSRGYNPAGDYFDRFNGTSAATPHVAGVAALVISVNPALTAAEVENILRSSTDDIDGAGYDIYTGFGRINAVKAVAAAAPIRWESPRMVPGWFGAEDQGGDIAVGDISRNGRPDLLTFHIDNPGGENHGYYRIGWNLNLAGIPAAWSPIVPVPGWFGAEDQGAGVALADISGTNRLDVVIYHIDNPNGENHGYYRIGWDLDPTTGRPTSWSPIKAVPGWFGSQDQGGGVAIADLNGDGRPEIIIFHIDNPGGENHGYYRIGWRLDAAGNVTGGWSPVKPIPGWFGAENQGGGIAVADINRDGRPELIVFHIDNPTGENHGYYRIGRKLNASGDVTGGWSAVNVVRGWFGAANQGGGIAVADINGDGRYEMIVYHIDNPSGENHGYYRIGWGLSG